MRNKTGIRVLFFSLFFIGLNMVFITLFYLSGASKTKFDQMESSFLRGDSTYQYLFLGHSRGVHGVEANLIDGSFNFCISGENSVYTYYKLKYLLEQAPDKFSKVVIPYGFGTFNTSKVGSSGNLHYWIKYVDFMEIGRLKGETSAYYSLFAKASVLTYFQYPKKMIERYIRRKNENWMKYNFVDKNEQELIDIARYGIERNAEKRNIYDEISKVYLEKLINLCEQYDKELIAIRYPVSRYYYQSYRSYMSGNLYQMDNIEALIVNNSSITTLDYESIYFDSDEYFRDVNHLNEQGRKAFSALLNQELIKYNTQD
jgi:hypothetical protein